MNIEDCPGIAEGQKTLAGLYGIWISGREYLRYRDPVAMAAWDAAFGAHSAPPSSLPEPTLLKKDFPAAFGFASDVGVAIYAVPGWFPAADMKACTVDWLRFACTMQAYSNLDSVARAKAISQRTEASQDACAGTDVALDRAYAALAPPATSKAGRSWSWLWVALPIAGVLVGASLAGSSPANTRRGSHA